MSDQLKLLQVPFAPHEISLLPKQLKRDDKDKYKCEKGTNASADGRYCGGYHARSIHLDYVGHAALTKRLLEVDPMWSWEPVALRDGLPAFDDQGGLWIKLTVCGVTRLGYGDSQGKTGPNAIKEAIGDALRNAGMRFGCALDLWHKGDLYDADELKGLSGESATPKPEPKAISPTAGVVENLTPEQMADLHDCAGHVRGMLMEGDDIGAWTFIKDCNYGPEMQTGLWTLLDSKERAALKKAKAAITGDKK